MTSSINKALKRALCVLLSAILAIGLSYPYAYGYESGDGIEEEPCSIIDEKQKTEDEAIATDTDAPTAIADDVSPDNGTDGDQDDQTDNPVTPNPTPQPQGPLTFTFNIAISPIITDIEQVSTGLMITWTPVSSVDGYLILRRNAGAGDAVDDIYKNGLSSNSITLESKLYKKSALNKLGWANKATIASPNRISWIDKNATYGQMYEYTVIAYKKNVLTSNALVGLPYIPSYATNRDISKPSNAVRGFRLYSPILKSIKRSADKTQLTVKWASVEGASGYVVECSKNSAFISKKKKTVSGKSTLMTTFTGVTKSASYCVRIRAYGTVNGKTQYSSWNISSYTSKTKRASMSRLTYKYKVKKTVKDSSKRTSLSVTSKSESSDKKVKYVTKTKTLEIRSRAGQKMGRYDTMQGGCSDGTYMYFILLNKLRNRCKIVKVKISTKKVVKKSGALKLNHGNGLAYNPDTKRIIVAHGEGNRKALTEINKTTLKKMKTHTVNAPTSLKGATVDQLHAYQGFGSIAYSKNEGVYVGLLYGSHNVVLLDSDFNMVKYIPLSKKNGQIYQCIEVVNDSILIGESFGSTYAKRYNILSTYNWDGSHVTTTQLQMSYELENVFAAGNKVYAGFYRSYLNGRKFMKDNYVYHVKTF